ncbi:MAG TPA: hypothetical protein PLN52_17135 [Opitutaceae bacterium]|nr:hypothetical protein [Opitutaceae bacterium]
MNSLLPVYRPLGTLLLCLGVTSGVFAFKKGDTAYAKRADTSLLAEPNALAASAGKAGFAEALNVIEVRGAWLQVKGKTSRGWIFQGNVDDDKPTLAPAAGLTSLDASSTNTVAAARPLSEAGSAYASRHQAGNARDDLNWLEATAAKTKSTDVDAYLKTNKKGEYRQ